jgi:NitT/TauT family transport system substrate-binding protein
VKRRTSLAVIAAVFASPRIVRASTQTIRVAGASNDVIKPVYYGIRSGVFEKYGLTVEVQPMNNGAASAAALVGGSIDVASTSVLTPLQGYDKGIPMRIIAPSLWQTHDRATVFSIVLKDSPIHSGRDLDGKTIAFPGLGDISAVETYAWMDKTGGDSKTVKVIEVPASSGLAFLEQGRADVVTMIEPFVSQAMASGKVRILIAPQDAIGQRFEGAAYIVMEPAVEKNRDAMSRFARGMHEATLWTNSHLPQSVDLVASYTGVAPEVVAKMNRVTDPEYVDPANIQPVIDVMAKYRALTRHFSAQDVISSAALKPAEAP